MTMRNAPPPEIDATLSSTPGRGHLPRPAQVAQPSDIPGAATAPRRGAVRLRWRVPAAGTAEPALSPEERDRAARFRFEADRDAFLAAHALKREMLAELGGLPPQAWRFVSGPAGKPEIDPALGRPWLRFNLTHTRSLVACAVTVGDDIGVDVESLDRRAPAPGLVERWFAPEEAAFLATRGPAEHGAAFLQLWTLKEAFVKATGEGIAMGLDSFAVASDPARLLRLPAAAGPMAAWRLLQLQPDPRHVLAVALRRRGGPAEPALG
jgi:4'-phosphopantetheinyl transferase